MDDKKIKELLDKRRRELDELYNEPDPSLWVVIGFVGIILFLGMAMIIGNIVMF